ncbi:DUF4245 family protein [Nocardioides bizhenqiangii]|uniref:DUF4245 family protein n=1 Tax=Nocardioides bizhenqiangii TaxID=3095076 RepID=A0ABZ0ZPV0_9ACTN|nr:MULTISPECIES: DUF4245 family protein [unclassified Nocardioides]MDZ5621374.1 DUF4245 family protein [Nocardioides sp. HM23]WQQ25786.1 DUF4245 family protein [Nocardioides sp. HM61]
MSTSSVGRPGKYQRSAGGLVAALLITVVVVGGLLWVLGLFRSDLEVGTEEVDYLGIVAEAQDSDLEPVYPSSLPDGWTATGYDITAGEAPAFELRMLTDDERFVAVHQESAASADLVREHVDEDATSIDIYSADGSVAEAWQGYEDEGGDTAYAADVGGQTVLVYGSASPEELQDLIGRLTTEPVDAR